MRQKIMVREGIMGITARVRTNKVYLTLVLTVALISGAYIIFIRIPPWRPPILMGGGNGE